MLPSLLRASLLVALPVLIGVLGCTGEPESSELLRLPRLRTAEAGSETTPQGQAPGLASLSEGIYTFAGGPERIRLTEGSWEDPRGAAFAQLLDLHAAGDFDGDGLLESAGILTLGLGGLDLRIYLVARDAERTAPEAMLLLGQRVQVRALRAVGDQVELTIRSFAPGDDPCCPTRNELRRYRIQAGSWVGGTYAVES